MDEKQASALPRKQIVDDWQPIQVKLKDKQMLSPAQVNIASSNCKLSHAR